MTGVTAGSLMNLGFGYAGAADNGNVTSQTIQRNGVALATQGFGYDGANRLTSASEGSAWQQRYVYDPVGNRALNSGSSVVVSNLTPQTGATLVLANGWSCGANPLPFDCKNRYGAVPDNTHDVAGNLRYLANGTMSQQTLTYDAENRLTGQTVTGSSPSPLVNVSFAYDGDGRRVMKTVGSVSTVYVYDPQGSLAASYTYGAALAPANGTYYVNQDHLGSTRLVTKGGAAVACHDYLPFGEEIPGNWGLRSGVNCYGPTVTQVKFTGKERDAESGLDYFGARYFSSAQGRFTSPDPTLSSAQLGNPQSWNRYAYVYTNPLRHVDPDGQQAVDLANPNVQRLLQTLRAAPGRTAGAVKGGLIQTLAEYGIRRTFGEVFGYTPNAIQGDLSRNELGLLNKVSAYEKGALMLGVGQSNQAGIDAVDLDNVKGISLKSASNIERAKDQALDALKSATKAGFQDVEVFIDAPSVSKIDATGLTKIQNVLGTGTVTKVVVFTGQGAVEYRPTPEQQKQIACKKSGDSSCQ